MSSAASRSLPASGLLPAASPLLPPDPVLRQVLAAIARNRVPGFHFPGNLLPMSFDRVARDDSRVSLALGPHNTTAGGRADSAALGVLADLSMATCIRAELAREVRLATVSMQVQLFAAAAQGTRLEARSAFAGYVPGAAGLQAVSRTEIRGSGGELVGLGTGGFMVLDLPAGQRVPPMLPVALAEPDHLPDPRALEPGEAAIYRRAEAAWTASEGEPGGFIGRFWGMRTRTTANGASGTLEATPHIGNRVGHVQGGVLFGFAEATARAALEGPEGGNWLPTSVSASYLRPGEPPAVRAEARTVHRGRTTAAVRVRLFTRERKQVLDALLAYAATGAA